MKEANEKRETRPWRILELILFVVSLVFFCIVFTQNPKTVDASSLNPFLYWIYALVLLAICVTLLFPLVASFRDKKKLLRLIILIVAVVVIVGGAWLLEQLTGYLDLSFEIPLLKTVCIYICIMELVSILENIATISPGLAKLLSPYLDKLKKETEKKDDENRD